jgi:hypothetical protein
MKKDEAERFMTQNRGICQCCGGKLEIVDLSHGTIMRYEQGHYTRSGRYIQPRSLILREAEEYVKIICDKKGCIYE